MRDEEGRDGRLCAAEGERNAPVEAIRTHSEAMSELVAWAEDLKAQARETIAHTREIVARTNRIIEMSQETRARSEMIRRDPFDR